MAGSLKDQLLGAGLADPKKAKQLEKEKRKAERVARKSREQPTDETREAARQAARDKAERDRELNRQRDAEAERRAVAAQILQLIAAHRLDRRGGELGFNFTSGQKIKKLYVTAAQQRQLAAGAIAIAAAEGGHFELVPAVIAAKIAERDPDRVIFCTEAGAEALTEEEQEWYKDYEVPDDLMW